MKSGELVNLFVISPHDAELACTPLHTGIFLEHDHEAMDVAWLILVDGKISSFSKQWWNIKKLQKQERW